VSIWTIRIRTPSMVAVDDDRRRLRRYGHQ
jgi:hypothetical protein